MLKSKEESISSSTLTWEVRSNKQLVAPQMSMHQRCFSVFSGTQWSLGAQDIDLFFPPRCVASLRGDVTLSERKCGIPKTKDEGKVERNCRWWWLQWPYILVKQELDVTVVGMVDIMAKQTHLQVNSTKLKVEKDWYFCHCCAGVSGLVWVPYPTSEDPHHLWR